MPPGPHVQQLAQQLAQRHAHSSPSPIAARAWVTGLLHLLMPQRGELTSQAGVSQAGDSQATIAQHLEQSEQTLARLVGSRDLAHTFFTSLSAIDSAITADAAAMLASDPAAKSLAEVIACYPGVWALAHHRIAHALHKLLVPVLPRMIAEIAHEQTGIDIHPGAHIGPSCCIDHGTGVVIGETSIIGARVKIYQGVTLGALSVRKDLASVQRHPTIEDDVVLYAHSAILGGQTVIGARSIIGGNVWLTRSVPPDSIVIQPACPVVDRRSSAALNTLEYLGANI